MSTCPHVVYYANMTTEVIVKGTNPSKMVQQALQIMQARERNRPEDEVLIKPNYVVSKNPSTGISTDSRIIEDLVWFTKTDRFHLPKHSI